MNDDLIELAKLYGVETQVTHRFKDGDGIMLYTQARHRSEVATELLARLDYEDAVLKMWPGLIGCTVEAPGIYEDHPSFEDAVIALADRAIAEQGEGEK